MHLAYNDGFRASTLRELLTLIEANRERIEKAWTNSLVRAVSVRFDEDGMWVELSDGRVLGVPLVWFPRLLRGTREREACRVSSPGLHWEALDEDISIAGLLAGYSDQTRHMPNAAE